MDERKTVLIAGASSGVGAATAKRFAAEGYNVCLNARNEKQLTLVRNELAAGDHLLCPGDFSDPATSELVSNMIADQWKRLDVFINSVGIYERVDMLNTPIEKWRQCLDSMLFGALRFSRIAATLMTTGGRIVHITSVHGQRAEKNSGSYSVAKAGIDQLCRMLALEWASRGILVNAIAPGFVDTPMSVINGVNELETEWFQKNYIDGHHLPLQRAAQPEEIAGAAYFLAGPDASYITGQVLTIDGGLSITF